jgi:hypothetical protein
LLSSGSCSGHQHVQLLQWRPWWAAAAAAARTHLHDCHIRACARGHEQRRDNQLQTGTGCCVSCWKPCVCCCALQLLQVP